MIELTRLNWLIHPIKCYRRRRYDRAFAAAVKAEVLTNDPFRAKYIVFQADGRVRCVVNNLFARNGDVANAAHLIDYDTKRAIKHGYYL